MRNALVLAALMISSTASSAANSIVGDWDFQDQNCEAPIRIAAMSLKSEDVNCQFKTVKRLGKTVTWQGDCDHAEGTGPQTVIATLSSKGKLTIKYLPGGNVLPNLKRCK